MIKRLFYKVEHGDKDGASDDSSSSGSEAEAVDGSDQLESEDDGVSEVSGNNESGRESEDDSGDEGNSSGHVSEDGTGNDDSSGHPFDEDDAKTRKQNANLGSSGERDSKFQQREPTFIDEEKPTFIRKQEMEPSILNVDSYILKCKSVFRCRICPTVVCLNDETLNAHLKSKRHARSEKSLKEGKLKAYLNSVGEIEREEEDDEGEGDELHIVTKGNRETKHQGHKKVRAGKNKKRFIGKRKRGSARGFANNKRRRD